MHATAHRACKPSVGRARVGLSLLGRPAWRRLQPWLPTLIALAVVLAVAAAFWLDPKVLPSYDVASGAVVTATRLPGLRAALERWLDLLSLHLRSLLR